MNRVAIRRQSIGLPRDMAAYSAQLLEIPGGRRDRARRTIQTNFKTNLLTGTNLCSDTKDGLHMSQLLDLAKLLDLPTTKFTVKEEIYKKIQQYVNEALICATHLPMNTKLEEAEKILWRSMNRGQVISAGGYHALQLMAPGSVVGWGRNDHGQRTIPKIIRTIESLPITEPIKKCISVSAGEFHSIGLLEDGSVIGWGLNGIYGQTIIPKVGKKFIAISAGGGHSLGLLEDGSVIGWGRNVYGQTVIPIVDKKFTAISAGGQYSLGLLEDGTVLSWGYYEQSIVPIVDKKFIAISAGEFHSLGLLEDGSVIGWGYNPKLDLSIPVTDKKFVAISAGGKHSLGLLEDGKALGWGSNKYGQSKIPEMDKKFIAISAGGNQSVGLVEDGSVVVWGESCHGESVSGIEQRHGQIRIPLD